MEESELLARLQEIRDEAQNQGRWRIQKMTQRLINDRWGNGQKMPKRCKNCTNIIVPDPTDDESWVHEFTKDAQCNKGHYKLDSWAEPRTFKEE